MNDLIRHIRESFGCRIGKDWFQGDLRRAGAHFGSLQHGAGVAIYVSSSPFTEVETRGGLRKVEVA